MRLRRSVLNKPGIARKRRGKGFAYYGPDGQPLQVARRVEHWAAVAFGGCPRSVTVMPVIQCAHGEPTAVVAHGATRRSCRGDPAMVLVSQDVDRRASDDKHRQVVEDRFGSRV